MKRAAVVAVSVWMGLAVSATDAHAQMTMGTFKGYLTGHVGALAGGEVTNERVSAGASLAIQEINGWGAELDFGRATDVDAGRQRLDLTTYMVNTSWVKPSGVIRPFATGGAGILQADGCLSPCAGSPRTYNLGLSVGGGTFLAINDVAALRADARYFFAAADHPELGRPDNLAFWRISVGATFIWAIVP